MVTLKKGPKYTEGKFPFFIYPLILLEITILLFFIYEIISAILLNNIINFIFNLFLIILSFIFYILIVYQHLPSKIKIENHYLFRKKMIFPYIYKNQIKIPLKNITFLIYNGYYDLVKKENKLFTYIIGEKTLNIKLLNIFNFEGIELNKIKISMNRQDTNQIEYNGLYKYVSIIIYKLWIGIGLIFFIGLSMYLIMFNYYINNIFLILTIFNIGYFLFYIIIISIILLINTIIYENIIIPYSYSINKDILYSYNKVNSVIESIKLEELYLYKVFRKRKIIIFSKNINNKNKIYLIKFNEKEFDDILSIKSFKYKY